MFKKVALPYMKWLAVFIAIASIVVGWILKSWPVEPCTGSLFVVCLNGLAEYVVGEATFISGIAMLALILLADMLQDRLSMLGAFLSFVLVLLFLSATLFMIFNFVALGHLVLSGIILGISQVIGFVCVGLSARVIKALRNERKTYGTS